MNACNIPVFSSFCKLRVTNPDLYYTAVTHRQMLNAQKRLGPAFYDIAVDKESRNERT